MKDSKKQENNKPTDPATIALLDAQRTLQETEELSAKTIEELRRQRELLHHSKNNLKETQENLHKSDSLLTRMLRCCRG